MMASRQERTEKEDKGLVPTAASCVQEQEGKQPASGPAQSYGWGACFSPEVWVGPRGQATAQPESVEKKLAGLTCSWIYAENVVPVTHSPENLGCSASQASLRWLEQECPLHVPSGVQHTAEGILRSSGHPVWPVQAHLSGPRVRQQ